MQNVPKFAYYVHCRNLSSNAKGWDCCYKIQTLELTLCCFIQYPWKAFKHAASERTIFNTITTLQNAEFVEKISLISPYQKKFSNAHSFKMLSTCEPS